MKKLSLEKRTEQVTRELSAEEKDAVTGGLILAEQYQLNARANMTIMGHVVVGPRIFPGSFLSFAAVAE